MEENTAKTLLKKAFTENCTKARTRFTMVKARHEKLWEKAKAEGKADEKMIPIVDFIFSRKDFFTTSTCSGRILLIQLDEKETKKPKAFFAKWHSPPSFEQAWKAILKPSSNNLWFKQEPLVMVIGTNSLENAKKTMSICRNNGVKKAGIMSAEEGKFLVEIMGSHYLSFLAKEKNKILADREFFRKQFETACKKLEANQRLLERLEKGFRKELK